MITIWLAKEGVKKWGAAAWMPRTKIRHGCRCCGFLESPRRGMEYLIFSHLYTEGWILKVIYSE